MQTIRVTFSESANKPVKFKIDGKVIAEVVPDGCFPGKYYASSIKLNAALCNLSLPSAIDFMTEAIIKHFRQFNIAVDFINE